MIKPGEGYSKELTPLMHETIKKVGDDYEAMKYNTGHRRHDESGQRILRQERLHPR